MVRGQRVFVGHWSPTAQVRQGPENPPAQPASRRRHCRRTIARGRSRGSGCEQSRSNERRPNGRQRPTAGAMPLPKPPQVRSAGDFSSNRNNGERSWPALKKREAGGGNAGPSRRPSKQSTVENIPHRVAFARPAKAVDFASPAKARPRVWRFARPAKARRGRVGADNNTIFRGWSP